MTPTYRILMDKVLIPRGSHAQPLRAQLFFTVLVRLGGTWKKF